MLNLGSITSSITIPDYTDILEAKIEYIESWHEFLNYKNVCEIIDKAKLSTESMMFAENLLGTSVDSIDISLEELDNKLATACEKFEKYIDALCLWISASDTPSVEGHGYRWASGRRYTGHYPRNQHFVRPDDLEREIKVENIVRAKEKAGGEKSFITVPCSTEKLKYLGKLFYKFESTNELHHEIGEILDGVEKEKLKFYHIEEKSVVLWVKAARNFLITLNRHTTRDTKDYVKLRDMIYRVLDTIRIETYRARKQNSI